MLKLDRTHSSSGNIFKQGNEVLHYKGLAKSELAKIFAYLNSVAYNYAISSPPPMDKTVFSSRKN